MFYLVLLIIFIILATGVYAGWKGAPWVPTWSKDIDRILKLAHIKPGEKFYDLGCGDGRLIKAAAQAGASATGLEVSALPYIFAKLKQIVSGNKFKIKYNDFWRTNLSDADLVYFFQMKDKYEKIGAKLNQELKPGTRVMSYVWPIPGWEAEAIDKLENKPNIYYYIK